MENLIAYIEELPQDNRYRAQSDILNRILRIHNEFDDNIESFYDYVRSSDVWKAWVKEEESLESWTPADEIVAANQKR